MTDQQSKYFFLTAAKVREMKREAERMRHYEALRKRADRWRFGIKFRLFRYQYAIVLHLEHNYAGGYAFALHPRPGETWLRGNDLRDGKLWRLPWVLWDILCYEFSFGRWRMIWRAVPQIINCDPTVRRGPDMQWPPAERMEERPVILGVNERVYPDTEEQTLIPWPGDGPVVRGRVEP